ncbi:LAETG motif-containing sortase-dependent surface protein [Streptomyces fuscigenes]|uniref:LAETG motif-containing sortase-dependent surface protein n=1 Tax=Streptomyces fuscigenes TaxID=1528880 RepID=UPI001F28B3EA|nr:LAETG motif-containing sortase-dependent surface protein [Streptomyces fuscigenes]MCF3962614.1 Cys-Gln thioester bond-forming surface protein [Streptomyces fuscigenes]
MRAASAAAVFGLLALGVAAGAGTASADDSMPQRAGGATAVLDGLDVHGGAVLHTKDADGHSSDEQLDAGLFEMNVDGGGKLKTYCVDIDNPVQDEARYVETPWAGTSLGANRDAGKVLWILHHSYPQVDDLSALAGAARTGALTPGTAAAGTQVAIWRLTDKADVDATDPQAERLADWLGRNARTAAEPQASLSLTPGTVTGQAGERVGPVTVHTGAQSVTVQPPADAAQSGVRITDAEGKPLTTAKNGSKLYFDVPGSSGPGGPASGTARMTVQATAPVPVGRAFAGVSKSQTQILAGSSDSTVSATATGTWAPSGAVATLTAQKNCDKGGIDVTATNSGEGAFRFDLADETQAVAPGTAKTITVPVSEDQPYDFTVTGDNGFRQRFFGTLDCRTTSADPGSDQDVTSLSAASVGGPSGGDVTDLAGSDLAETGSSSATPVVAGVAIALVIIGGGVIFVFRTRKGAPGAEG